MVMAYYTVPEEAQQQQIQRFNDNAILTIKVFVFFKDLILLTREKDDAWAVPALQWKMPDFSQTHMLKHIIALLKEKDVPPELIDEVQFSDFSHTPPLAATKNSSVPGTPSEMTILSTLTTTHPAMGDVADEKQFDLPPDVHVRWADTNTTDGIKLSPSLSTLEVDQARQRLVSSNKESLSTRLDDSNRWIYCSRTILGILQTRAVVERTADLGYGLIAVSPEDATGQRYFQLRKTSKWDCGIAKYGWILGHQYGESNRQVDRLMIVGRWKGETVEWLERFDGWEAVIDSSGRLREGHDEERV